MNTSKSLKVFVYDFRTNMNHATGLLISFLCIRENIGDKDKIVTQNCT